MTVLKEIPKVDDPGVDESIEKLTMGCHEEDPPQGHESGPLACGECHVERKASLAAWRELRFDYSLHYRHVAAAGDACGTCHHVYDEAAQSLVYREKEESACRDCHGERDEEHTPSLRRVSHRNCLSCHLDRARKKETAGPVSCVGCHDGENQKAYGRVKDIPRLDRGQPDLVWIHAPGATSNVVPFDHEFHETVTSACSDCHHKTLSACKECHTLVSGDGASVSLKTAYHLPSSSRSCCGCHARVTAKQACIGCHSTRGVPPGQRACAICHVGPLPPTDDTALPEPFVTPIATLELPAAGLNFPEKVVIEQLAGKYEASEMPHSKILESIYSQVRDSKLARRFHGGYEALCTGCHHQSPVGSRPTPCEACHGDTGLPTLDKPSLFGAYHRQCLGCHRRMQLEEARGCTDCHKPVMESAR